RRQCRGRHEPARGARHLSAHRNTTSPARPGHAGRARPLDSHGSPCPPASHTPPVIFDAGHVRGRAAEQSLGVQEGPQPPPGPTAHAGGAGTGAPPGVVEAWPSVAPFGEADRISVSIIALAFLCSSAGSTFASPGGNNHTWPPTAQTTGLDQVSGPGD